MITNQCVLCCIFDSLAVYWHCAVDQSQY
jgi:hypothetical protein